MAEEKRVDKQPLVSVIMPCYNHEEYVGQAIESVINQTYKNIEFIILDNGSTDHSFDVINRYSDKVSKIYQLKHNDLIRAGRILIDACEGEYVAFMTSDDLWEKTKLEKQMEVFQEMSTVKCCFTWANEADESLENIKSKSIFTQRNRSRFEWLRRLIQEGNCLAYPSAVVEKKIYMECLKKLKQFYQLNDWYLWILILQEYDIYVVEEPLVCFRWHQNGENHNMSAPSDKATVRLYNETAEAIDEIIENMDKTTLKNTFPDFMLNVDCNTEIELQCEKLFVLMGVAKQCVLYEPSVMSYFYKNSCNEKFLDTLKKIYGYSYMKFQDYSGDHGIGHLVCQTNDAYSQINILSSHIQILSSVLCSDVDVNERKMLLRKKLFMTSNIQREIIQLTIETLQIIEKNYQKSIETLQILRQLHVHLCNIWEKILMWDVDIKIDEWGKYCKMIQSKNVDEINFESILVFIKKVELVLKDCIEI